MQFLYFSSSVQSCAQLTAARAAELGLGYMPDGHGLVSARCVKGPDGQAGVVFCAGAAERLMPAYRPEHQRWAAHGGSEGLWVGVQEDNRPSERSLRRRRFLAGEEIEMGGGEKWTIPIARSLTRGASLPRRPCLGADRRSWTLEELPEFRELSSMAEKVFGRIVEGLKAGGPEFDLIEATQIAALALGTNYRVSAVEIDLLGLFDSTDRVLDSCMAIVDWFEYARVSKAAAAGMADGTAEEKKRDVSVTAST